MTRPALLLLAACLSLGLARVAQAEDVLGRLAGRWSVNLARTLALGEMTAEEKELAARAGEKGLAVKLAVEGTALEATVSLRDKPAQVVPYQLKVLAEDNQGAFLLSIAPGGVKKSRVQVTYLDNGDLKIWFAEIGYPLIFVREAAAAALSAPKQP